MNIPSIIMEVNWSNISSSWVDYAVSGYQSVFSNYFYPLCFLGLVGYVYFVNRSAIAAGAIIAVIFAVFSATSILGYGEVYEYVVINYIIFVASCAGLVTTLFMRRYR